MSSVDSAPDVRVGSRMGLIGRPKSNTVCELALTSVTVDGRKRLTLVRVLFVFSAHWAAVCQRAC